MVVAYHRCSSAPHAEFCPHQFSLLPTTAMFLEHRICSFVAGVVTKRQSHTEPQVSMSFPASSTTIETHFLYEREVRKKLKKQYPIVPKECKIQCGLRMMGRQDG
jgi:hypothetical protein